ncbi:MAG: response regulator transcription factor [Geminicoccaceae bacterium]|nr:response regulator transcription factor [Geminicoccaceae bacterium]
MNGKSNVASDHSAQPKGAPANPGGSTSKKILGEGTFGSTEVRVLLIDSKPLRRAGLQRSLLDGFHGARVTSVASAREWQMRPEETDGRVDLAILHIGSAEIADAVVAQELTWLREALPDIPIVLLADRDDTENVAAALRLGIRGYLPTSIDPAVARSALQLVLAGGAYAPPAALLGTTGPAAGYATKGNGAAPGTGQACMVLGSFTPRQRQVLELLAQGRPNKVIARHLNMCESTVKVHVRQIMRKLGASNRTEVALKLRELLAAS